MSVDSGDKGSWSAEHLPSIWKWTSFYEFWTDHTDSKRKLPQNRYLAEGVFPVVDQGANLIGGYANDGTKKSLAPLPAIIFGDHTRVAKYIDRPFIQGADGVRVLCAAKGVDPLFAYHALRCVQLPDKGYSRHFKFLKATQFPLAPLSEQRRIVAKIDILSAKSKRARDHVDHIPRLVEKYKQAILAAAYSDAQRRSEKVATLGTISVEVRNGLSKKPSDDPNDFPILRISAVRSMSVRLQDVRYYPENVPEAALLRDGDLLFTRYNGNPDFTAVCGRVAGLISNTAYPDKLIRVRLSEMADPRFVEAIASAPQSRDWLHPYIKTAAGQHGISGGDLKLLPVPLPPLSQQQSIAGRIETAFNWIMRLASETASARKLIDHLDQAILAKGFRGELVPQDPNDEPASVLLERLKAGRQAKPMLRSRSKGQTAPKKTIKRMPIGRRQSS
jgi:hypothetical protein